MMEKIRELNTIKKTNKVTNEQSYSIKKKRDQRVQKVLLKAKKETKESKGFDAIKMVIKQNNRKRNMKRSRVISHRWQS